MQKRGYIYSLVSGGETYLLHQTLSTSFGLLEGYPTISANLAENEQIAELLEAYNSGELLERVFTLRISLTGVKDLIQIPQLVITRLMPVESNSGYTAAIYLIPQAAAIASAYPATFSQESYQLTVSRLIGDIVAAYNTNYKNAQISNILFESPVDPICFVAPRFLQLPYLEMVRTVAARHGMVALLDFDSRLRVFVPTRGSNTSLSLGKHLVSESSLTVDSLQTLVG